MRALIQRVNRASVTIHDEKGETRSVGKGMVILLGIEEADGEEDINWLVNKIVNLRIFDDENGVMNRSVKDIDGDILVVSQFTLHARVKKGNRPSYIDAAGPETSVPLYNKFNETLSVALGKDVATGEFGAVMDVDLVNNGPVTIFIDTKNKQ
ncbi:MAG: D-aminoacyl-tRNA deacylase [Marinilabilia sp.]